MYQTRKYDVIVWGASGFTGRLVAEYLYNNYSDDESNLRWAIGGRNQDKLKAVRAEVADETIDIILADSHDQASLSKMVKQTKVVATTVGPYAKYGSELVAQCVAHNTHYCDLAGEVQWMRKMIDTHHSDAKANGTKIVHTCGFDSIPSDMGVYYTQQQIKDQSGNYADEIKMRVRAMKGEMSGGTYASLSNVLAEAEKDKSLYKVLTNPYGLNPDGEQSGPDQRDLNTVMHDSVTNGWIFPFVMAGINTKVVRRSHALSGYPYGKDFMYEEAMMGGKGISGRVKSTIAAGAMGVVMMAKPGSVLKNVVDRILPDPGEGPDRAKREAGFYKLKFHAYQAGKERYIAEVMGDMDPGYGSTSKMLAESAVCLAKDRINKTSGVLTPSVAMGDALLDRLREKAGLSFTMREV